MKLWLDRGKTGDISDKDFQGSGTLVCHDVDNSGEINFSEFISFLGSCGTQFDAVNKEQRALTKEQRNNCALQRLSLLVPKDAQPGAFADAFGIVKELSSNKEESGVSRRWQGLLEAKHMMSDRLNLRQRCEIRTVSQCHP